MSNKPIHELPLKTFAPEQILVDAATYQFRAKGDANGVTKKHHIEAEQWDSLLHGAPLIVHERLDGKIFVADGHHRLDFAKKLAAKGEGPKQLAAYVLREAEGYSAEDAKIAAAYANMARGREDPVESARVLKEARQKNIDPAKLPHLNMQIENLKLAYTLSGLSDASLERVERGDVPVKMARMVAERVALEKQDNVMRIISTKISQPYSTMSWSGVMRPTLTNYSMDPRVKHEDDTANDNQTLAAERPESFTARVVKSREFAAALRGL